MFAIGVETENDSFKVYDISNNDITNSFDTFYDNEKSVLFYVTKNFQAAPTTNIKIIKQ